MSAMTQEGMNSKYALLKITKDGIKCNECDWSTDDPDKSNWHHEAAFQAVVEIMQDH